MIIHNIEDIQGEYYPPSVEVNPILNKMRFFLGDRWIDIGKVVFAVHKKEGTAMTWITEIEAPDADEFLESREYLNDGTEEWVAWGSRVN